MLKRNYQQEPPFAVQIEMTEGCNFRCTFCGLNGIRGAKPDYKFMTVETAAVIANEIARCGWHARIEFAMHGEPSFNPKRNDIIKAFREALPKNQLMMTSNGSGFVKNSCQQITDIMAAGLNVLALDDYEGANMVPRIRDSINHASVKQAPFLTFDYPEDGLEYSPHRRWPVSTHRVIYIKDISKADDGTHATLNNHCGAAAPPNNSAQGKRCAKPFRELSIRWDGSIAICCNDWRGEFKVGNALKTPLDALWNHERFQAARRFLYAGQRTFKPCEGCDALSYKVGLLPDHRGKVQLPAPSAADRKIVAAAVRGATLTQIVLRPWEGK